jgi:hypothetical protein
MRVITKLTVGLALMLSPTVLLAQTATVTGTFKTPSGIAINGYVLVSMTRGGVTNSCVSPVQVMSNTKTKLPIVTGSLQAAAGGSAKLFPTSCLNPAVPYTIEVWQNGTNGSPNVMLYRSTWIIPVGGGDATTFDPRY